MADQFGGSVVAEQEIIDVRVSRRILRVGGEVYQLRTITRAAAVRVTPNRRRTAGRCAGYLLIAAIVLLFVDFALFTSGVSAERESRVALVTVFAVLLLVSLARLTRSWTPSTTLPRNSTSESRTSTWETRSTCSAAATTSERSDGERRRERRRCPDR
ncbi:DUF6232 family protein [Streptomyces griseorubiginosus]|uniref:DUF6232 family protein n=1 Tax=Streptomyces griseorubiginosus TaxID=67304 RepID=UPI0036B7F1D7